VLNLLHILFAKKSIQFIAKIMNTAPDVISPDVMDLIRNGYADELMEAIYDERANDNSLIGESLNGKVKVTRVGQSDSSLVID